MAKTTTKTFSIDQKIYEKFEQICDSKRINKSKVLQDAVKNFIGENYDINKDMFYKLRYISNPEIVKIESKDRDFIILSNGNKMNIFDFEMLYEEEDLGVAKVMNYFGCSEDVDQVDPEELFDGGCSLNPDMLKKEFENVDVTKVKDTRETVHYREISHEDENDVLIKDERTMEEKVAEMKEKHMIEELRNKCANEREFIKDFNKEQNEDWINKIKQKQIIDSIGTAKVETAAEEFLNQPSINPENFREILDAIDPEKIDPSLDDKVAYERRTVTFNPDSEYKVEEEFIEQITISEQIEIVKKIKEKSNEIWKKDITITELSELLSYVYYTEVKIEELIVFSEKEQKEVKMYLIFIPKKYHNHIELEILLSKYDKYEYRDIDSMIISDVKV